MIFIATGANASANNLGKISIKTIDDITPQTIEILNYFGKTWTDDKKIAIDDFLVSFNAASWKSKVKIMYMPILMPIQNNLLNTQIQADLRFKKNIADWNTNLVLPTFSFLASGWASLGVNQNGVVFQPDSGTGTVTGNASFSVTPTSFGITNKAVHWGIYFKASTKFRAGQSDAAQPSLISTTSDTASFFNNFSINATGATTPKKQLTILNGDVTVATSKSYNKTGLLNTTIINTQASTVQTNAGVMFGGNDNIANDSTASFMTFGNYMTDAELLEYSGLINTLMDVLVV